MKQPELHEQLNPPELNVPLKQPELHEQLNPPWLNQRHVTSRRQTLLHQVVVSTESQLPVASHQQMYYIML
jgi:hypothetical protein